MFIRDDPQWVVFMSIKVIQKTKQIISPEMHKQNILQYPDQIDKKFNNILIKSSVLPNAYRWFRDSLKLHNCWYTFAWPPFIS